MIFSPEKIISQNHACTLTTIISIESFISENSGQYSRTQLWKNLPKKVMYQSYKVVLEYLEYQGKIYFKDSKIFWNTNFEVFNIANFPDTAHLPTLTTLSKVEEFIFKQSNKFSKTELWKNLPKKVMYQSYKLVLEYLQNSGLITIEKRKVVHRGDSNE